MSTSVKEIAEHGGPTPSIGETKDNYYARVATWARAAGNSVYFDSSGYPTINWGVSHGAEALAIATTGAPTPATVTSGIETGQLELQTASIGILPAIIGGVTGAASVLLGAGADTGIEATKAAYETAEGILQGPGVPEPIEGTYYKSWHTKYERRDGRDGLVYFWALNDGRIVYWDNLSHKSGVYRPKKPVAVIMRGGKMSMQDFLKADRYLDKFARRLAKRSSKLAIQKK